MNEYYKEKLEQGLQYQDFVVNELFKIGIPLISYSSKKYQYEIGENKAGFEIKYDSLISKTGNLYIETHEKSCIEIECFSESGILRNDNSWLYVIGDYNNIFILSKYQLIKIYQNVSKYYDKGIQIKEIPTSIGFVIPVEYVRKFLILKEIKVT